MPRGKQSCKGDLKPGAYADGALGFACRKTRLCNFFMKGHCPRGSSCKFAHGEEEIQKFPDLTGTKMCPDVLKFGECKRGASCRHAHSPQELRPVSEALTADAAMADALAAQWDRRAETCGSGSEASSSECLTRAFGAELVELGQDKASSRVSSGTYVVEASFLDVADRLTEGNRLIFFPTGVPLTIRNTFFEVDDRAQPTAARRARSAAARLALRP